MKQYSHNYPLAFLELLGTVVLILVILALATTPAFFHVGDAMITAITIIMMIAITILAITSFVRRYGFTSYRWLTFLAIMLLIIGGGVFYGLPQFFYGALALRLPFWYRVSLYTLPAICVEGGLLTLFTVFVERGLSHRSSRERMLISVLFVAYAVLTIGANFLVVNRVLSVEAHLALVRWFLAIVAVLFIGILWHFRNKPSFRIW